MDEVTVRRLVDVNGMARSGASAAPVFVLCAGRSGSTLLRFLLDTHPDLACPPETNLPALCAQLATVWSLIEGAPLAQERGDEPPVIPDAAIAGIRHTMDLMVGSYLARRGKKRYCDKSLGTARFAELLLRVYPDAKFLCLYRHPMDVIASGIEACPWGLNGYGFEPYIAGSPGNVVLALARFWVDNMSGILASEEQFPDSCHRLRYEDVVADPEAAADGIFRFLGVPAVPGISARCFTPDRERFGPADHKIWYTSRISATSVGRGWSIPLGLIAPPVLEQINGLADRLGYIRADEKWGTTAAPADVRVPDSGPMAARGAATADAGAGQGARQSALDPEPVGERLRAGLRRIDDRFTGRWELCSADMFQVIVTPPAGTQDETRWRVDLAARTVTPIDGDDGTAWDVVGSAEAWLGVLRGDVNLSVALRRCELRYCDTGDAGPVAADTRIGMLADFLGLTSWPPASAVDRDVLLPATAAVPS